MERTHTEIWIEMEKPLFNGTILQSKPKVVAGMVVVLLLLRLN